MDPKTSHLEIAYSSIRCFADDGTLDESEVSGNTWKRIQEIIKKYNL